MIVPIVEGHAERESVPVLIRRILQDKGVYRVNVRPGVRVPRDKLLKPDEFERRLEFARRQPGARAITVIVDADNDCPRDLGPRLLARGLPVAAGMPLSVVLARMEMEAWFIAGIESLRGVGGIREDVRPPGDPETIADAKGWLTRHMLPGYSYMPVDNQSALAQRFDYVAAAARSRSLRKFLKDLTEIAQALA